MSAQPEALRLADWLDHMMNGTLNYNSVPKAAAELRRLHAENADYGATIDYLTSENAEQIGEIVALKEQRDELLAALRWTLTMDATDDNHEGWDRVHEAIAKATGETK